MILSNLMIDKSWSLFLDRDGVLNKRIVDGYVTRWEEFSWLPGVLDALKNLSQIFGPVVVVSNQQGVGKGIMTANDVENVHSNLLAEAKKHGARIDAIYYSPHLAKEGAFLRKPNVGMGLKARKEFPAVRFRKSVMAGDSLSDMLFGRQLGMKTVFLSENISDLRKGHKLIDYSYPDLAAFSTTLLSQPSLASLSPPPSPYHHITT
ncbi:D-glycero-alpha-D-manno-heptose-1,7-bisphosphate 7-phosphatase [Bacteroidota bacterium]